MHRFLAVSRGACVLAAADSQTGGEGETLLSSRGRLGRAPNRTEALSLFSSHGARAALASRARRSLGGDHRIDGVHRPVRIVEHAERVQVDLEDRVLLVAARSRSSCAAARPGAAPSHRSRGALASRNLSRMSPASAFFSSSSRSICSTSWRNCFCAEACSVVIPLLPVCDGAERRR